MLDKVLILRLVPIAQRGFRPIIKLLRNGLGVEHLASQQRSIVTSQFD